MLGLGVCLYRCGTPPSYSTDSYFFDAAKNLMTITKRTKGTFNLTPEFKQEFPDPVDFENLEQIFVSQGFSKFEYVYTSKLAEKKIELSDFSTPNQSGWSTLEPIEKIAITQWESHYKWVSAYRVVIRIGYVNDCRVRYVHADLIFSSM